MKNALNERGILPVLVAIFVVVLLAGVGLAIYNFDKSQRKNAQTVTTSSPSPSQATTANTMSPSPASTYLDIKELGIKIRLSSDIEDVVYAYNTNSADSQGVWISSRAIMSSAPGCKKATGALGSIGKTKNPDQGFAMLTPNNSTVFKFGDYYVYYNTPDTSCGAPQSLFSSQLQSFEQAFKTVQPD